MLLDGVAVCFLMELQRASDSESDVAQGGNFTALLDGVAAR